MAIDLSKSIKIDLSNKNTYQAIATIHAQIHQFNECRGNNSSLNHRSRFSFLEKNTFALINVKEINLQQIAQLYQQNNHLIPFGISLDIGKQTIQGQGPFDTHYKDTAEIISSIVTDANGNFSPEEITSINPVKKVDLYAFSDIIKKYIDGHIAKVIPNSYEQSNVISLCKSLQGLHNELKQSMLTSESAYSNTIKDFLDQCNKQIILTIKNIRQLLTKGQDIIGGFFFTFSDTIDGMKEYKFPSIKACRGAVDDIDSEFYNLTQQLNSQDTSYMQPS